ncbi:MAG: RnfABCDGE type electron transport complex subunit G [Firmicutes bacterium]|nr:RnfABCDGE type electron transport complex subunit G [Bacillota bacterium]
MKNNNFKENIFPAIVLVCICLVVTLALAGTYSVANPKILDNQQKAADEARMQVLPDGDSFTEFDGKLTDGVIDCYIADNKAGIAVTSEYKGFGGSVKVMTGIGADGKVTGVTVTEHGETPGLGTKAMTVEYLEQYKGVADAVGGHINNDENIDAITGATITSNAVYCSVVEALAQFKECGGVK